MYAKYTFAKVHLEKHEDYSRSSSRPNLKSINLLFPSGIGGSRSVGGVRQDTPELRLVAFVN